MYVSMHSLYVTIVQPISYPEMIAYAPTSNLSTSDAKQRKHNVHKLYCS